MEENTMVDKLSELCKTFEEFEQQKKHSFIKALKEAGLEHEAQSVTDKGMPSKIFISKNVFDRCQPFELFAPISKNSWLPDSTIVFSWLKDEMVSPLREPEIKFVDPFATIH